MRQGERLRFPLGEARRAGLHNEEGTSPRRLPVLLVDETEPGSTSETGRDPRLNLPASEYLEAWMTLWDGYSTPCYWGCQ